jgi:hypothetical protein
MSANFHRKQVLYIYKYKWNARQLILKKKNSSDNIFDECITGNYNLVVYILEEFGLIREKVLVDKTQSRVNDYKLLKNLLISILENGNSLEFKFHIDDKGIKIWKPEDKCYIFEECWWEMFIEYIFRAFNIGREKW